MAKMNPSKLRNVLEALPSCGLSNTKKEAIEAIITKYLEGDIVPVVRCKDCEYYRYDVGDGCLYCCQNDRYTGLNDFCSYGERKDNE